MTTNAAAPAPTDFVPDESFDYRGWTDDELAAEAERLAGLRTRVRLAQNRVAANVGMRTAIRGMDGATRAYVLELGGDLVPTGGAEAEVVVEGGAA